MAQHFDIGALNTLTGPVFSGTNITLQFTMTPATSVAGWGVALTFRQTVSSNAIIKQYTTGGGGITITDSTNGVWSVQMSRADTLLFGTSGTYAYDFKRTDVGSEAVLTYGAFQVSQTVNP